MQLPIRRLRWLMILATVVLLALLEWARFRLYPHMDSWTERLALDGFMLLGILLFFGAIFESVIRLYGRLEAQNRELLALQQAAQAMHGELDLEKVLQNVVDQARLLLGARYGAISVINAAARIEQFVTSGISGEQRELIGEPPKGKGLLGVGLHGGQRLRVADLGLDPRSIGFPEHHPSMTSLLAVPVQADGPFTGNLYVSDRQSGEPFTVEDEETLARFATQAAMAIDNAYLHRRLQDLAIVEDRVRISREMHDGMAQVLAYVNTKAQAVTGLLRKGRGDEADEQLEQLATAAREVYQDVREGIAALRSQVGPGRPLRHALEEFLEAWRRQSGIAGSLVVEADPDLPPNVDLQLLRIVQEALSNVRKHSGADTARVSLRVGADQVTVEVEDNGDGFPSDEKKETGLPRFGLVIMRERAESIGGKMDIESQPGKGTRVRVELPIHYR